MIDRLSSYISAIEQAEAHGRLPTPDILSGYSGDRVLGLLQRLTATACGRDKVYCEIGVFRGLSLLSVAAANPLVPVYGIDNFSYFDPDKTNKRLVLDSSKAVGASNVVLLDLDYEAALREFSEHSEGRQIGVLFIDGPHDYRSQFMCLMLARRWLADNSLIVVDDSNYDHVRQANRDFLRTHGEYKLLYENYTDMHPMNMEPKARQGAARGWWNGVNVIVRDCAGELPCLEPAGNSERELHENDHVVHAMRHAHIAPETVQLANMFYPFRPLRAAREFYRLFRKARRNEFARLRGFDTMNVGSRGLQRRLSSPFG